jgi:hypothetical protein
MERNIGMSMDNSIWVGEFVYRIVGHPVTASGRWRGGGRGGLRMRGNRKWRGEVLTWDREEQEGPEG